MTTNVAMTVSKTLGGTDVADSINGGGSGYDLGRASAQSAPIAAWYFRHDGVEKITEAGYYIATYSGTYGGDFSAATDLAKVREHGDASKGLVFEEDADAATPFADAGTQYRVKTTQASSYATRRTFQASSMIRNNASTEATPSAPVAGEIGAAGDTALGDVAKLRSRYEMPESELLGGRRQWDTIGTYAYSN